MNKQDWTYKTFGEIMSPACVERCGERKLPVLSITMRNGIVEQNERFSKSIASNDKSNYKVVKNGQLVIAFPIDEGLLYTQDVVPEGIMSPAYNIWDVDYSCINRRFLVTFFHSSFAFAYYKAKLKGTTQRRRTMDKTDLLSMPIPVPPIEEQERIVAELDLLQGIIEKKKEQLKAYDQLAQSIFYTMFGDPIDNPKGWETKRLGDVCSLKAGKAIKAAELKEKTDDFYPCYGGNGIRGYIDKISHKEDLPIIGRQGALCGNVNFAKGPFYATEHAVVVTPLIEMNKIWLFHELKCSN
ncbi:MAG: restriction endonuclease subunit S, partial [Muribaculaceae bacterium]|nr:restriction endonuclease subunit S [Muribaculaceae bacterium]